MIFILHSDTGHVTLQPLGERLLSLVAMSRQSLRLLGCHEDPIPGAAGQGNVWIVTYDAQWPGAVEEGAGVAKAFDNGFHGCHGGSLRGTPATLGTTL